MKLKTIIVPVLVATMLVANTVTAFASQNVNGAGIVEYDNSVDVTYDSITLPTLNAATYNFTLDPTDMLHTYNPVTYARESTDPNPGIYFYSEKTGAKIEELANNDANYKALFKLVKTAVASDAADWKAVVTAVDTDGNATAVTGGYYVWTPDADSTATTGKTGKYTELAVANVGNYFDISAADGDGKYTITMKENHLSGNAVCDGKLYMDDYQAISSAIQDNKPTVNIADYVTITKNDTTKVDEITAVTGVYVAKTGGGYQLATAADIKFTPATVVYQAKTDKVVVTNKSTKAKTVKAVVTMSNITGLTFNDSATFESDDAAASVFFKATDGTAANDAVLTQGETTATATYTLDVAGADLSASGKQITYQGGINAKTGGHDYFKYEAVGTTYNSNSFWIEAKANINAGAKEAWKEYGDNLTAAYDAANADLQDGDTPTSVTPAINIVYSVTDKSSYTDLTGAVVTNSGVFYVGTASNAGFASTVTADDVASVTVNGKALTAAQINVVSSSTGIWVGIPAASITAIGEDNGFATGTEWTFVVIIGTDRYTASYTKE